MTSFRRVQQCATFARVWHLFDCKWQDPYLSAERIISYLKGIYKPIYHPMADCGDVVVAINTKKIALRGDDWRKKAYFHHTGYPGGASWTLAWELHDKDPTLIVKKAVYRQMRGNLQRRHVMQRLLLYSNDKVPLDIMGNITHTIPTLKPVPERLDHIPQEVIDSFPKVMEYPENYILK
ncbi:mitochondrial ribosomal protein L13 [Arctopsyche grandis]|uniref:mitochondrial ribosomal protein L13 n=1 Tax=Arctopsyche grandis TaxID=121162 RepID=UPI00406D680A